MASSPRSIATGLELFDPARRNSRGTVIVALVERMDGAKIAAQSQLDGVGGRNGFYLAEQAFGFGEFAKIRFLERAVEREFGRVDIGR